MLLEAPTPTAASDGAVAHDDVLFLILHYLESTGLFATTVALLLESGLDHRWLCGPSRAMAQLRAYILRGEFALALALLEPLQAQAPTTYARVHDAVCAHAFLEACVDAAPIPSRLRWLQALTKSHTEYGLYETLAFTTTPNTVHPTLASWNTAQRRLQCFAEVLADVRELPNDDDGVARYLATPPMQLQTLVAQALRYQAHESNQDDTALDCLRPDAVPLPAPTQHLLRLASTPSVDDKKTTVVTASMVLPPKRPWTTIAPQNNVACQTESSSVLSSEVGSQASVAVDATGVQTAVVVATLGVQTREPFLASAEVQTTSIDSSTTSAQTEPSTADESSHFGVQTDVAEVAHTESQTPTTTTQDVGQQAALHRLVTDADVQTTTSTLCDASMQTTVPLPSAPAITPLVLPTPTAEPTLLHRPPPPASTDFIRLSMTVPPPVAPATLGRRNDMVRLSDGLAHLSRQSNAFPQAPPTPPKPNSPVLLSTASFSNHRTSVPVDRAAKPSTYDQAPSPATAVVVAETREAQAVRALQVSHHGKYLLVGTNARAVRVLNVRDALAGPRDAVPGAALALLPVVSEHYKHHSGPIYCAAWNCTDTLVATGSTDGVIHLARPFQLDKVATALYEHTDVGPATDKTKVRALVFAPTSDRSLASIGGYEDNVVRVWDLSSASVAMHLPGHGQDLLSMQYHAIEPHLLLTSAHDRTLRTWDLRTGCCTSVLQLPSPAISMACHPVSGSVVASAHDDGTVALWDARSHRRPTHSQRRLTTTAGCRPILSFSPHGAWLLLGGFDGSLLVLNDSLDVVADYSATVRDSVVQAVWHTTLPAFVTSGASKSVKLWAL
ncbi:hypothetical protein SDRG_13388 [Saprolegnia diclina VS20]|uniref:LisH domain-containing protein n=1 Tax=Saprolegnia diclina (strain VS20) TaxID=1156394 RepID=T0R9S4_SAPDV|nr:hypothetical protein SDRG_13388 [Saprolegnia diclina VS20]EQC28878.1 hypothetical protein SDRG_13388 [Saprolegnia diclina VS20]|eukprot:XP_008617695.1 hypothetical protein SDRG_13388 [Saprolegnia diclina VS20]